MATFTVTPSEPWQGPEAAQPAVRRAGNLARGLKRGLRLHSRFSVLIFFAALTVAAALVFQCSLVEWCLLLAAAATVLAGELFHGAVAAIVNGLEEPARTRVAPALDIAAGGAFVTNVAAALIGLLILVNRILPLLMPLGR